MNNETKTSETKTSIDDSGTDVPVACTLSTVEAASQVLEWADLRGQALEVAAIDDGARMRLPAALAGEVEDLVRRESQCCAFLRIETKVVDDVLVLDICSPNPDAQQVVAMLAGLPLS